MCLSHLVVSAYHHVEIVYFRQENTYFSQKHYSADRKAIAWVMFLSTAFPFLVLSTRPVTRHRVCRTRHFPWTRVYTVVLSLRSYCYAWPCPIGVIHMAIPITPSMLTPFACQTHVTIRFTTLYINNVTLDLTLQCCPGSSRCHYLLASVRFLLFIQNVGSPYVRSEWCVYDACDY